MVAGIDDWFLSLNGWVALAIVFAVPALEASALLGSSSPVVLSARRTSWQKVAAWCGARLVITLVTVSRVYLGVHWWTDVAAGAIVTVRP